jgi:hypothetical protein
LPTIQDLAARWQVTVRQARATVIDGKLPMIRLKSTRHNVNWSTTRFDPADVEAWEAERNRAGSGEGRPAPNPAKVEPLGGRPSIPNHLGF